MPRGQPIAAVALAVDASDGTRKLALATAMNVALPRHAAILSCVVTQKEFAHSAVHSAAAKAALSHPDAIATGSNTGPLAPASALARLRPRRGSDAPKPRCSLGQLHLQRRLSDE